MKFTSPLRLMRPRDWLLWGGSVAAVAVSCLCFPGADLRTVIAALIGVSSLMLAAKKHPLAQVLMLIFSALYGWVSFDFRYYGEMLTYLGMTAPMAAISLYTWMKHPENGTVAVRQRLSGRLTAGLVLSTAAATAGFGYLLAVLRTANLPVSIVSVTTSFSAAYLTACRSPFFALCYAANDAVLLVLWVSAARTDASCIPMVTCFVCFLLNDCYGFLCWRRGARTG